MGGASDRAQSGTLVTCDFTPSLKSEFSKGGRPTDRCELGVSARGCGVAPARGTGGEGVGWPKTAPAQGNGGGGGTIPSPSHHRSRHRGAAGGPGEGARRPSAARGSTATPASVSGRLLAATPWPATLMFYTGPAQGGPPPNQTQARACCLGGSRPLWRGMGREANDGGLANVPHQRQRPSIFPKHLLVMTGQ